MEGLKASQVGGQGGAQPVAQNTLSCLPAKWKVLLGSTCLPKKKVTLPVQDTTQILWNAHPPFLDSYSAYMHDTCLNGA